VRSEWTMPRPAVIQLTSPGTIFCSEPMHDRAFEQKRHRGEADMRMRTHVEADAGFERRRAHVIEEDERSDQTRGHCRQHPPHSQTADIAQMRFENCFDRRGHGALGKKG